MDDSFLQYVVALSAIMTLICVVVYHAVQKEMRYVLQEIRDLHWMCMKNQEDTQHLYNQLEWHKQKPHKGGLL